MNLTWSEEQIVTFLYWMGYPKSHYHSFISKKNQTGHFGLAWEYQKMSEWLVLSIEDHNHASRARKEPSNPKQLTFGDHVLRNMR